MLGRSYVDLYMQLAIKSHLSFCDILRDETQSADNEMGC